MMQLAPPLPVSVRIRRAKRADLPSIASLHTQSWQSAYRTHLPAHYLAEQVELDLADQWARTRIREDDVVLVAVDEEHGGLIGFISVWCRPDPFIDNLHCIPHQTSRGVGTRLIGKAFQTLNKMGKNTATLSVLVGNDRARDFYLKLGGRVTARRRETIFGYPVDVNVVKWDKFLDKFL